MTDVDDELISRFADLAADALAAHREEIDALNVFPVPDSDTGTNLYLTLAGARDALRESEPDCLPAALEAYARGALLSARGNSGVIVAEMIGASMRRWAEIPDEPGPELVATVLRAASDAAYRAVGDPQEGTILTVGRAAADAAAQAVAVRDAEAPLRTREVIAAAAQAARESVAHTTEQLDVLARAGVIDAGGRGLSVLLDAVETAVTGRRPAPTSPGTPPERVTIPVVEHADLDEDGPSYEVMYLLDAEDAAIPPLREALAPLGDSMIVVGGGGLWNVHVHVDDVGAAIEAGIAAGRPHRVRVTHFADQVGDGERHQPVGRSGRAVVAVSAGPGLTKLFRQASARVVERNAVRPPTTTEILDEILASGAAEVIVLPNDPHSVGRAEAAARAAENDHDLRVAVIPSYAQVQGLAAMAVHEPGRTFDGDVLEMTATARHARHGGVTIATRRAITMAGPCLPGDVLGIIDGDFIRVGQDRSAIASQVLELLIGGGGELVTIVSGAEDADGSLAAAAASWVAEHYPTVDTVTYDGGQERYHLLVAVE